MKVLIIGATGDVGSEATKRAVVQGHQVRALVRPSLWEGANTGQGDEERR